MSEVGVGEKFPNFASKSKSRGHTLQPAAKDLGDNQLWLGQHFGNTTILIPAYGPGRGPAQRARHNCLGLQDLPVCISQAWVCKSRVDLQV